MSPLITHTNMITMNPTESDRWDRRQQWRTRSTSCSWLSLSLRQYTAGWSTSQALGLNQPFTRVYTQFRVAVFFISLKSYRSIEQKRPNHIITLLLRHKRHGFSWLRSYINSRQNEYLNMITWLTAAYWHGDKLWWKITLFRNWMAHLVELHTSKKLGKNTQQPFLSLASYVNDYILSNEPIFWHTGSQKLKMAAAQPWIDEII